MRKRTVSVLLAVLMLLSLYGISPAAIGVAGQETDFASEKTGIGDDSAFDGYCSADSETVLSATQENGSLTEPGDSVSWQINLPKNTVFMPKIEYCALEGTGENIEMSLLVDGELPFEKAKNFLLYRIWKNATNDYSKNRDGNEFSPEQVEVFCNQTSAIYDTDGFITTPLLLYMSAGEHTISLTVGDEPVRIIGLRLEIPKNLPSYAEYCEKITDKHSYTGDEIVIEGENADFKSQKSFVPQADRNHADISPSDPFHKKINYIGGTNWNTLGGEITWIVTAPEDGWYRLGFHFRQNYLQEGVSYRKLMIDRAVPFEEAQALAFPYKSGWQYFSLSDENGKEMPVFLSKGEHSISLTVTLGKLSEYAEQLKEITNVMGTLYRKIVKITGENSDANRDYELFRAVPELEEQLPKLESRLEELIADSEKITGAKGGSNAQIMRKALVTIRQMLKVKYEAHTKLSAFYDNYSSLCSWLYEMQNMALDIDTVLLTAPDRDFRHGRTTLAERLSFTLRRLLSTYVKDYTDKEKADDSLLLWLNWGRDQITLLDNLISNDFTPKTGIDVCIKITSTSLVQAGLAGNGPDLQLSVPRTDPINYAMRGLLYDLTEFPDYNEVMTRFNKTASVPYTYRDGVYGLPSTETFQMLFIRTDVFDELDLQIPKTWDEYIEAAKVLSLNHLDTGMVNDGFMFMTQMGVSPYTEDKTATNLMSSGAIEAFTFMTDFFTKYKFPVTYSFFNRFRTGLMPMAIAPYVENATLRAAAPEINGKWRMVTVPGFQNENGTVSNTVNGTGTANVILNWSDQKEEAWEFLKWWTSDEIQYRFSVNIESILGASGRYASANMNAVYRLGWDKETLSNLKDQFGKVVDLPEVPGSYYVSRSVQQVFWNVVNNGQNVEDMLEKWIPEADDEIRRKTEEYVNFVK